MELTWWERETESAMFALMHAGFSRTEAEIELSDVTEAERNWREF